MSARRPPWSCPLLTRRTVCYQGVTVVMSDSSSDDDGFDPNELAAVQEMNQTQAGDTKQTFVNNKVSTLTRL